MRTWKQPSESRLYTYDFTALLAGRTISGIVGTPDSVAREGGSTLTLEGAPLVAASVVQVEWSGGDAGTCYLTTVKVTDNQGEEHELEGEILVVDVGFALPPGIVSTYMTAEDYTHRFGFEETIRLTDEDRKGVVDVDTLTAALNDATEIANSYLGVRYTIPLNPVPPVIKTIVADLAREKLMKQRPTPAATQAADLARSMLKDLSAGRMVLPQATGEHLPTTPTFGLAAWGSSDAVIFNPDKMDRFVGDLGSS